MRSPLMCTAVCLWLLASSHAYAQDLVLVHANVVDVREGQVTVDATLVVRDGVIVSVGAASPSDSGAPIIDVGGRYVVPGLIDAHTHIASLDGARRAIESGVTTARSAGVAFFADVNLRELVRNGTLAGPEIVAAGLFVRGDPSSQLISEPSLGEIDLQEERVEILRAMVRVNLEHDVQVIKIGATLAAGSPSSDPRQQAYTEEELRAVVQEAATQDLPVEAHAHGDEGAQAAVKAGVRSIEHGTWLSDETLELMKARGTFLVPTYSTVRDLAEPGGDYDIAFLRNRGRHMLAALADTVSRAHRIGVPIATGADTPYGPNSLTRISHEVTNLIDLGMSPLDALQSATIVAAELIRLEGRIGAIEVGLEADLVAIRANPLQTPEALWEPLLVVSNGRVVVDRLHNGLP